MAFEGMRLNGPCPTCGCGECQCDIIPATPQADSSGVTQVSGSWSFAVSTLDEGVLTSSNNAVLLHNTVMPSGMETQYSEWIASASGVGDDLRFIFLYASSTNYWYAKVIPGATDGQLRLFQVTAGPTHTQRGSTDTIPGISGAEGVSVQACINLEKVSIRAFKFADLPNPAPAGVAGVDFTASVTIAGTKIGQGTGTVSSTCTFFSLVAKRLALDPDCECAGDCFTTGDETGGDCDSLAECCQGELGTLPATAFLSIASGGLTVCAGSPDTLSSHTMVKMVDDCIEDPAPQYSVARRLWYFSEDYVDPAMCGSTNVTQFYFYCNSCLSGVITPVETPCNSAGSGSYSYLVATKNFGASYDVYPMTVLSCDPFYAESPDGKIVLTE